MFVINQDGLPPGTVGVSRSDGLRDGSLVTVTYSGPGQATFTLLWAPEDDTTASSSFSNGSNEATFTPDSTSIGGTYRIHCIVNNNGIFTEDVRLFAIRTVHGLRIPALNERADSTASLVNRGADIIQNSEFNEPSPGRFSRGDYGGWYSSWVGLVRKVEQLSG